MEPETTKLVEILTTAYFLCVIHCILTQQLSEGGKGLSMRDKHNDDENVSDFQTVSGERRRKHWEDTSRLIQMWRKSELKPISKTILKSVKEAFEKEQEEFPFTDL